MELFLPTAGFLKEVCANYLSVRTAIPNLRKLKLKDTFLRHDKTLNYKNTTGIAKQTLQYKKTGIKWKK